MKKNSATASGDHERVDPAEVVLDLRVDLVDDVSQTSWSLVGTWSSVSLVSWLRAQKPSSDDDRAGDQRSPRSCPG